MLLLAEQTEFDRRVRWQVAIFFTVASHGKLGDLDLTV